MPIPQLVLKALDREQFLRVYEVFLSLHVQTKFEHFEG